MTSKVEMELALDIATWCADNGIVEGSRLLGEEPYHCVDTFELLDYLSERTGLAKEELGTWFNKRQDELRTARETQS